MRTRTTVKTLAFFLVLAGIATGCSKSHSDSSNSLTTSASGSDTTEIPASPTYRIELSFTDVQGRVQVLVNGFPIRSTGGGRIVRDHIDPRIMTALVRGRNRVEIEVDPWVEAHEAGLRIGDIKMSARVSINSPDVPDAEEIVVHDTRIPPAEVDSAHAAWSQSARQQWKTYRETVAPGVALDSLRAWARRHPMTVQTTFDNEHGPDFSDLFEEAPIIEGTPADSARLRAYAMHLRDLMATKDTTALFEAYRPAIDDRFERLSHRSWEDYRRRNRTVLVLSDPVLDFDESSIDLHKWVDGRIWQISRDGAINNGFFQNQDGSGLGAMYVAEVNDTLRVVR